MNKNQIAEIYDQPLTILMDESRKIHVENHCPNEIQKSTLLSIKTGGCPEDCSYCSQSSRYKTNLKVEKMMSKEDILKNAVEAKKNGSKRFCMATSGTRVRDNKDFDSVIEAIKEIKEMGMETCVTLGMLKPHQAEKLKEAGLDYYNHNIDTSPEYYSKIITTRTFEERIDTISCVKDAGIKVCTGGILGLGESKEDRISMLEQLSKISPESITINRLVAIKGTPLENNQEIESTEIIRTIATARILMPKSAIRLSAGREKMSDELQLICFYVGANSVFGGEKLLTTKNKGDDKDKIFLKKSGLVFQK